MIKNVADLLKKLMEKETEVLREFEFVKHGPMIGNMYEGLTTSILEKTLPNNIDIRVVSGMIVNSEGQLSNQIDCMIVDGEGKKLPYSNDYVYDFSQVIVVVEIKKTLYRNELIDSYQKMKRLFDISDLVEINVRALRDAYRQTTKRELPDREALENLSLNEQMIYHTLVMEEVLPLRIVFGYYGYTSEHSLREAFYDYLKDNMSPNTSNLIKGFGPHNFPNLIVANSSSLVKLNAMPYIGSFEGGYWDIYASTTVNPLLLLLEVFWTRLSYKYKISTSIFGEDLDSEVLKRFISACAINVDGKIGWKYRYYNVSKENLESVEDQTFEWQPPMLDDQEYIIINWLCREEGIKVEEDYFVEWLDKEGRQLNDIILSLKDKGLAYLDEDKTLRLLTDNCAVVIVGGQAYAAEDKSGRLTRWVMNQSAK